MDEVDGMSSGDRGGMTELIGYIQKTKVPIICICNDRQSPKMRTLSNHCLDLRFRKPTVQQVSNRLFNIAKNEGFNMDLPTIRKLAEGTNGDIRQMLHLLQFWSNGGNKNLSYGEVKNRLENASKDLTMGPWDVAPKFFYGNLSLFKGIEYYFVDYSLLPLMIQENYLNISSNTGYSNKWSENQLFSICSAAQSIADGDLIDHNIRKSQQYAALPYHGILSCIKPGKYSSESGRISGRILFPQWLGRFGTRNKNKRLFSELAMNINSSFNASNITPNIATLDYLAMLKDKMVEPMKKNGNDGIEQVVQFMKLYNISRNDWDTIYSLGSFIEKKNKNKANEVPTRTKTAFTKRCTAEFGAVSKQKKGTKKTLNSLKIKKEDEENDEYVDDEEPDKEDDDIERFKVKTKKKKKTKRKKN